MLKKVTEKTRPVTETHLSIFEGLLEANNIGSFEMSGNKLHRLGAKPFLLLSIIPDPENQFDRRQNERRHGAVDIRVAKF